MSRLSNSATPIRLTATTVQDIDPVKSSILRRRPQRESMWIPAILKLVPAQAGACPPIGRGFIRMQVPESRLANNGFPLKPCGNDRIGRVVHNPF